ncbi:MAG: peptidylprolyl isomerase [Nanoarchaeota archaeon]
MTLKANDFIELDYTGKVKGEDFVFDTTDEKVAKAHDIHNPNQVYSPAIICIGKGHILRGLDQHLIGKKVGDSFTVNLTPEEAFGKKRADMIQLIPTSKFKKDGITPHLGLQVQIDGIMGTVKTVTGGRTLVDFNHPLSSKELTYDLRILKKVDDLQEKVAAFLKVELGGVVPVTVAEGVATVALEGPIPVEAAGKLITMVKDAIPELKELLFTEAPSNK